MIFTVKQTVPQERVLFESNKEEEAIDYLDNLILLGNGWFELWEKGYDVPIQAGGEQAFSPFNPTKLDVFSIITAFEKILKNQEQGQPELKMSTSIKNQPNIH